jgi:hypothetical protein
MPVQIEGAGEVTGLNAIDIPVYADENARDVVLTEPIEGQLVWLTDPGVLSVYDGAVWEDAGLPAADFSNTATGTYTDNGVDYKYVTFTASGTLTVTRAGFADVLIVGGGGGGSQRGGGGAGGHLYVSDAYLPIGSLTVSVGGGGAKLTETAFNGSASLIGSYVAVGGGFGVTGNAGHTTGGSGGSGGGGANSVTGGSGTANQGNSGGTGITNGGGGGGGSSSSGGNAPSSGVGGSGGNGTSSSITNTAVTRAGGGGGGGTTSGGSADTTSGATAGTSGTAGNATANTGSGGGGGAVSGGNGGSGVVIVRVRT